MLLPSNPNVTPLPLLKVIAFTSLEVLPALTLMLAAADGATDTDIPSLAIVPDALVPKNPAVA
jgi:hypothetical protein